MTATACDKNWARKNEGLSRRCLGPEGKGTATVQGARGACVPESSPRPLELGVGVGLAEATRLHTGQPGKQALSPPGEGSLCPRDSGFCVVSGTGRAKPGHLQRTQVGEGPGGR